MILSFRHKGLEQFFRDGSKAGIHAAHAKRVKLQLTALDSAVGPENIAAFAGWKLHALKGDLAGHWAITVSGNWRITFRFAGENVEVVALQDYH